MGRRYLREPESQLVTIFLGPAARRVVVLPAEILAAAHHLDEAGPVLLEPATRHIKQQEGSRLADDFSRFPCGLLHYLLCRRLRLTERRPVRPHGDSIDNGTAGKRGPKANVVGSRRQGT